MKKTVLIAVLLFPIVAMANGEQGRSSLYSWLTDGICQLRDMTSQRTHAAWVIASEKAHDLWDEGCFAYGALRLVPVDELSKKEYKKFVDHQAHEELLEKIKEGVGREDSSLISKLAVGVQKLSTPQWWKETIGARTLMVGVGLGSAVAIYAVYKKFFEYEHKPDSAAGSVKKAMQKRLGALTSGGSS